MHDNNEEREKTNNTTYINNPICSTIQNTETEKSYYTKYAKHTQPQKNKSFVRNPQHNFIVYSHVGILRELYRRHTIHKTTYKDALRSLEKRGYVNPSLQGHIYFFLNNLLNKQHSDLLGISHAPRGKGSSKRTITLLDTPLEGDFTDATKTNNRPSPFIPVTTKYGLYWVILKRKTFKRITPTMGMFDNSDIVTVINDTIKTEIEGIIDMQQNQITTPLNTPM